MEIPTLGDVYQHLMKPEVQQAKLAERISAEVDAMDEATLRSTLAQMEEIGEAAEKQAAEAELETVGRYQAQGLLRELANNQIDLKGVSDFVKGAAAEGIDAREAATILRRSKEWCDALDKAAAEQQ